MKKTHTGAPETVIFGHSHSDCDSGRHVDTHTHCLDHYGALRADRRAATGFARRLFRGYCLSLWLRRGKAAIGPGQRALKIQLRGLFAADLRGGAPSVAPCLSCFADWSRLAGLT